jgi:hypothetical protein
MKQHHQQLILNCTGAESLYLIETIQELWSGYGTIMRLRLEGASVPSVVVKHVRIPTKKDHPAGWNSDYSHQRKIRSYEVETAWYTHYSSRCTEACRVPLCYAVEYMDGEILMVLEDLNHSGFPRRRGSLNMAGMKHCITWLAHFHALFMHTKPAQLWKTGTYWHLATRPDELKILSDKALKHAAAAIDAALSSTPFLTFVHGDAKLANFCFSEDGNKVTAVDFQYTGGGCGMKDLAYFAGSCLHESACEQMETEILDHYFKTLKSALTLYQPSVDASAVETSWRPLYHTAWTDFHRFLKGWSPGHWKLHTYSEKISQKVIKELQDAYRAP